MKKKRRLNHRHWFSLSLISIILAGVLAGGATFGILYGVNIAEERIEQPIAVGETFQESNLRCEDQKKYPHPEFGCICKEEYRSSTNIKGTFCLDKGRQFSYWPE
tara:strand:+ start:455 stop:769 length:315 start_codon:yes stop_codon:yes gene_type:complete